MIFYELYALSVTKIVLVLCAQKITVQLMLTLKLCSLKKERQLDATVVFSYCVI